ncbi:MAG: hypothetical protein HY654_05285, partial [Acidobacteria bacterium]|nr:hypothetical protein [Acidobacteriota bacterium]
ESDWVATILGDRAAVFLYTGLIALDRETLDFLNRSDGLLGAIYREHAAAFAAYGRSLVVQDEAIVTPGGEELVATWEAWVGAPARRPDRFIRDVLGRERGRLAPVYDTLAQLDPSILRCVLQPGGSTHPSGTSGSPSTPGTLSILRRLWGAFAQTEDHRRMAGGPFTRQPEDFPFVLQVMPCDTSGRLLVPGSREMWRQIVRGESVMAATRPGAATQATLATPVDLIEEIFFLRPSERRVRLEAMLFMARVFGGQAPMSGDRLVALARGFVRHPALFLTLERIGIRDAHTYERAARHALQIDRVTDRSAITALAQFQAAIAMLDRFRVVQTIDLGAAKRLLDALLGLQPAATGYRGAVSPWLHDWVLPELRRSLADSSSAEETLVRALAGRPAPPTRTVVWEDITYLVDPAASEAQRITRLRRRQGEATLDEVLAFTTVLRRLERDESSGPEVASALNDAIAAAGSVKPPRTSLFVSADFAARVNDGLGEWKRARGRDDRRPILERLMASGDAMLAHALMSLIYAVHVGDPDDLTLGDQNASSRHNFGLMAVTMEERRRVPWSVPVEQTGAGTIWHVSGSLFGFDVALAQLALRRIITNQVPPAPRLATNDRHVIAQQVGLANPFLLTDAARDAIADGVARGRTEARALAGNSGAVQDIAARVRLGAWRTRALEWVAQTEPEPDRILSLFSLSELFWLGVSGDTSTGTAQRIDAWGTSMVPVSGCFCLRMPLPIRWEELSGRPSTGLLATTVPDLTVRIAELLAELDLPAMLARGVLAAAAQDLLDEAQPLHSSDWHSLVAQARSIGRDRFSDYVSSLASGGPLIYVSTPGASPRDRADGSAGGPDTRGFHPHRFARP